MRLFGWFEKFYFPEIEIRWPKKNAFDHGNHFTLLFSLQSISGKFYRERESVRARESLHSPTIAISPANIPVTVDRDLAFARSQRIEIVIDGVFSRSVDREIAYVGERGGSRRWRERKINGERGRSRSRLREIAPSIAISRRRRDRDRAIGLDLSPDWIWVVACVFLDLCFPSSFPNTRKFFPENFLKCNQTHGNIFLFRKLAFPENMYFPKNVLRQPNTA